MPFSPRTGMVSQNKVIIDLAKAYMKTGEISEYLILFFGLPFLQPGFEEDEINRL